MYPRLMNPMHPVDINRIKPSELLIAAKEKLERDGWTKHLRGYPNTQTCTFGAIDYTLQRICGIESLATISSEVPILYSMTLLHLYNVLPDEALSITSWNDADSTTFTDVLDVFDHAIKRAQEAEALEREQFQQQIKQP